MFPTSIDGSFQIRTWNCEKILSFQGLGNAALGDKRARTLVGKQGASSRNNLVYTATITQYYILLVFCAQTEQMHAEDHFPSKLCIFNHIHQKQLIKLGTAARNEKFNLPPIANCDSEVQFDSV